MYQTCEKEFDHIMQCFHDLKLTRMAESFSAIFYSEQFLEMDHLSILNVMVQAEHEHKMNKQVQTRLKEADLKGCSQELTSCVDTK